MSQFRYLRRFISHGGLYHTDNDIFRHMRSPDCKFFPQTYESLIDLLGYIQRFLLPYKHYHVLDILFERDLVSRDVDIYYRRLYSDAYGNLLEYSVNHGDMETIDYLLTRGYTTNDCKFIRSTYHFGLNRIYELFSEEQLTDMYFVTEQRIFIPIQIFHHIYPSRRGSIHAYDLMQYLLVTRDPTFKSILRTVPLSDSYRAQLQQYLFEIADPNHDDYKTHMLLTVTPDINVLPLPRETKHDITALIMGSAYTRAVDVNFA